MCGSHSDDPVGSIKFVISNLQRYAEEALDTYITVALLL